MSRTINVLERGASYVVKEAGEWQKALKQAAERDRVDKQRIADEQAKWLKQRRIGFNIDLCK